MIPVILHYALTFLCMELQEHLNFTCLPGSLLLQRNRVVPLSSLATSSRKVTGACANTNCLFSAQCRLSAEQEAQFSSSWSPSTRAQCVCPQNCASYEYKLTAAERQMLLCGDDFTTYSGECELRKAECKQQARLKITLAHECGGCDKCSPYAKCVIHATGFVDCNCQECNSNETVSSSLRSTSYNTVCGTDGITYQSECELNRTNCVEHRFVNIHSYAACNANNNHNAPAAIHTDLNTASNANQQAHAVLRPNQQQQKSQSSATKVDQNSAQQHPLIDFSRPPGNDDNDEDYLFQPENGSGDGGSIDGDDEDDIEFDPRNVVRRPQNISISSNPVENQAQSAKPTSYPIRKSNCPPLEQSKCRRLGVPCALAATDKTSSPNDHKRYEARCVCTKIINNCTHNQQQQPVCGESTEKSSSPASGWRRMFKDECAMRLHACEIMQELVTVPQHRCNQNAAPEMPPCGGRTPARNSATGREYTCAEDINRGHPDVQCPPATFCDVASGRCCPVNDAQQTKMQPVSTLSLCDNCNPLGTLRCEQTTKSSTQCVCKNGVMGASCDKCMPGYWGMPRVASSTDGCRRCECYENGSERSDCEQTRGQCSCRKGVVGEKCDQCSTTGQAPSRNGCENTEVVDYQQTREENSLPSSNCAELVCKYGATCVQQHGRYATCVCKLSCSSSAGAGGSDLLMSEQNDAALLAPPSPQLVCGSDGITYTSLCHLQLEACRFQRAITVTNNNGHCVKSDKNSPRASTTASTRSLYESCQNNYDCRTTLAICFVGRCQCPDGLIPSGDKQRCLPADTLKRQRSASASFSPSTTKIVPSISTAITTENRDALLFDENENEERSAPSFDGHAYYEMPALEGSNELNIEIHLRPLSKTGIVLYNNAFSRSSNSDDKDRRSAAVGNSDFVAITMRDGLVRFVYNLGDGPVVLQSQAPLTAGKRHTIVARRYQQGGMLQVDGRDVSKGRSPGTLKVLNLNDKLYIGWTPDAANYSASVYRQLGTLAGFVGCLYLVKIDGRPIDLPIPSTHQASLISYSSSALRVERVTSCLDNACRTLPCLHGGTCSLRSASASSSSNFRGPNFYTVKPFNNASDIAINGFVCHCPSTFTGTRCERRFDPCWSTGQCATENATFSAAGGRGDAAIQQHPTTWSKLLSTNSFAAVTSAADYHNSEGRSFSRIPNFNGNSYMKLPMLENATHRFSIELWLRPEASDGLILYNGQSRVPREADFVELAMHDGFLTFTYNLGSGSARIKSPYKVALSEWHTITIERDARDGRLTLDEFPRVLGTSPGQHKELNLNEPLYIGGLPFELVFGVDVGALAQPSSLPPAAAAGTKFFVGAIQRMIINGRHYDDFISVWEDAIGLGIYEGPPCFGGKGGEGPCRNGGECVPVLGDYHCKCFHGFTGETCSQRIVGEGLANGDYYEWQQKEPRRQEPLLTFGGNGNLRGNSRPEEG